MRNSTRYSTVEQQTTELFTPTWQNRSTTRCQVTKLLLIFIGIVSVLSLTLCGFNNLVVILALRSHSGDASQAISPGHNILLAWNEPCNCLLFTLQFGATTPLVLWMLRCIRWHSMWHWTGNCPRSASLPTLWWRRCWLNWGCRSRRSCRSCHWNHHIGRMVLKTGLAMTSRPKVAKADVDSTGPHAHRWCLVHSCCSF